MRTRLRRVRQRKRLKQGISGRNAVGQLSANTTTSGSRSSGVDNLAQPISSCSQLITANFRDSVSPFELDNNTLRRHLCPTSADSRPVVPANLLLDGSIVVESSITISESSSSVHGADALDQRAHLFELQPEGQESVQHSSQRESTFSTTFRSITSIGRRLGERFSSEYLDHIQSVLRSSSGSSWRSSLFSITSTERPNEHCSTLNSNTKLEAVPGAVDTIKTNDPTTHLSNNPRKKFATQRKLTKAEQNTWDMLVDETKLAPIRPKFLAFGLPDMAERSCCNLSFAHYNWFERCSICGNNRAHWLANTMSVSNPQQIPTAYINHVDFFGNTPLHYLMYRPWPDRTGAQYNFVLEMMKNGANIRATNNFGQTFLHCSRMTRVLNSLEATRFLHMIRELSKAGFPLEHRDHHGQTVLHTLLMNHCPFFESHADFYQLAENVTNTYDIFGQSSYDLVVDHSRIICLGPGQSKINQGLWINNYLQKPGDNLDLLWQNYIQRISSSETWIEDLKARDIVNWINGEGDSVLHAAIKSWSRQWSESELGSLVVELVAAGADIEMRDREGNTALAVSAVCGFRPSVKALLDAGANIHCRNFEGNGVLLQCSTARTKATDAGDEVLYARVLSCSALLADAGAKQLPSDKDEWMLLGPPVAVDRTV